MISPGVRFPLDPKHREEGKEGAMATMTIFVIENPSGMRSRGGNSPTFDEWGKVWRKKGHITNHLIGIENSRASWRKPRAGDPEGLYAECEVVEYELVEKSRTPVQEYIDGYKDRRRKAAEAKEQAAQERREKAERAQLAKLKAKYEQES